MVMSLSRRALLRRAAAASVLAAVPPGVARAGDAPRGDPWVTLDATAQADLIRRGEASPLELVEAAIRRIEALDPEINAVVTEAFARARETAQGELPQGPFRGVPYLIKDLDNYAGVRRTSGSRLFAEHIPDANEPPVQRSVDAGLIVLGKSNTPEFGLLATTESLLLGACYNPWDLKRSSGGSSGGAAAAVAAGMVPFAHATDGGGSIRIPASCCGVFGLKPSRGRRAYEGDPNLDISAHHCVSRTVRDSARLLAATQYRGAGSLPPVPMISGPGKRRLKVALQTATLLGEAPHRDVEAAVRNVAALCESLGHRVEETARPEIDGAAFMEHFMALWASRPFELRELARERGLDPEAVLEPWTLGLAAHFERLPEGALERTSAYFADVARRMEAFFDDWDVLLTPVLRDPPIPLGEQAPTVPYETLYDRVTRYVGYTPLHNAAGTPAMSVPLSFSASGLPIGSQFAARAGDERTLLELAYELERARPWARHWPGASAPRL